MKILVSIIFASLISSCVQIRKKGLMRDYKCKSVYNPQIEANVYSIVDHMPEFPRGIEAFKLYVSGKVPINDETGQTRLTLDFEFIVDNRGNIVNPKVRRKEESDYTQWDRQLISVVKSMPKWTPGKCGNKKVAVWRFYRIYRNVSG